MQVNARGLLASCIALGVLVACDPVLDRRADGQKASSEAFRESGNEVSSGKAETDNRLNGAETAQDQTVTEGQTSGSSPDSSGGNDSLETQDSSNEESDDGKGQKTKSPIGMDGHLKGSGAPSLNASAKDLPSIGGSGGGPAISDPNLSVPDDILGNDPGPKSLPF